MDLRYDDVVASLRRSYDAAAERRDNTVKSAWKLAERAAFLDRLKAHDCRRLLEIGAGTGQDSVYFADHGLGVVATDLSVEMVARCRAKGLDARVADFLGLDFPSASFDAVYALNCLLHVPNADLPTVLAGIHRVLRPGGLFYVGLWALGEGEGIWTEDTYVPPRFFSWRTDEQIQQFAKEASFEILDFHVVYPERFRFQSLTLRAAKLSPL